MANTHYDKVEAFGSSECSMSGWDNIQTICRLEGKTSKRVPADHLIHSRIQRSKAAQLSSGTSKIGQTKSVALFDMPFSPLQLSKHVLVRGTA